METIRWPRRGLRRAHHRRLLRQHPGPCGGDAARARRPQTRRASGRGGDRRGARSPCRAARSGDRRPSAAPAGAYVNSKAKRRAWSIRPSPPRVEPEDAPVEAAPLAPLVAPEGPQVFDVDAESAGERLDRFLGQAAAARRIALSRTRLKALIEAGDVSVDGQRCARSFDTARRGGAHRLRGAVAGGLDPRGRGHSPCRGLRGRPSDRDRQAGRARRPSGAGPCGRHAGQRADPALRGKPVGRRRGQAARNRAPARQGHVRASGRRQDRRCALGPGRTLRRSWPHWLA